MAKNLSERIAERIGIKKPSRNAQNRAAFLAMRVEVEQALNDGWPVKTIWETLFEEGKITFSYQAFRGYVNRLIHQSQTNQNKIETESKPEITTNNQKNESGEQNLPAVKTAKPSRLTGFTYNPVPNIEELI